MRSKYSNWIATFLAILISAIFLFDILNAWQSPVDLILDILGILGILVIWAIAFSK